jgi:23S rRNA pseudouridine2605 synthase
LGLERLQKIIARAGIASRRAAEELVESGRVRVNGRVVRELGTRADPRKDRIEVNGKLVVAEDLAYVVLHKPRGYVATMEDPEGRPTVAELVKGVPLRIYPVGRLDFHTSGVLLMTNDGELAQALLHPKGNVDKIYVVKLSGEIDEVEIDRWRQGVELDDGRTRPADVHLLRNEAGKSWLRITLRQGKNRQIHRMAEASGFQVMRLARLSFAGITAEDLRPGQWRPLTVDELKALKKAYGVPKRIRSQTALGDGKGTRLRAVRNARSGR